MPGSQASDPMDGSHKRQGVSPCLFLFMAYEMLFEKALQKN
jgi:hypothetical protein